MLASDTDDRAAKVQLELLRRASVGERARLVGSLSRNVISLSRRALRETMPDASEEELAIRWLALAYGEDLAQRVAERLRQR
jgi:hypothetical protein